MRFDPNRDHRRSIRLQGYDYSQTGAYFVTVCTQNRRCLLGEIVGIEMQLNDLGRIIQAIWETLPDRFPSVRLDQFVIMPNHVHGIIALVGVQLTRTGPVGAQFITPPNKGTMKKGAINRVPTATLGEIVRVFKAVTTRQIHLLGRPDFRWQRNYYEHVVCNEWELDRIRQYIVDNPAQWAFDRENPAVVVSPCRGAIHGAQPLMRPVPDDIETIFGGERP